MNRQFGVEKLLRVVLGDLLCTDRVILRKRSVAFIIGKRYFLPIAWLTLRRSAVKVTNWGQGLRDLRNVDYFALG